ncbi:MAG: hypothetical protein PARBB_00908 [Parabacteroides distasonis]|uniref:Lin1244/Lin1753 domain-containing protein n=1 Tax=Parabacteroides sp. TaxID=1869337 RepID=UPI00257C47F4|nr:Lin1244/Lin1753 domain-containing protein [Parabacteroides sp.]
MARPIKKRLDYFPLDTDLLSNRKIRQIKRKYESDAFLLYIALLCDIYVNDYYITAYDLVELYPYFTLPEDPYASS